MKRTDRGQSVTVARGTRASTGKWGNDDGTRPAAIVVVRGGAAVATAGRKTRRATKAPLFARRAENVIFRPIFCPGNFQ